MSNLRPRQVDAIAAVTRAYQAGYKAPVMVAPTGFGKTHTSADIIRRALAKGKRIWFLAHLQEILYATAAKLRAEEIPYGLIMADQQGDRRQAVQIVSVFTLARRLARYEPPDFIIVDEAHLAIADTYQAIFKWAGAGPKHYRPGGAFLLHLTATPQRLDGRGMGEVADIIVPTCSTGDLIAEGLLAPIRYFEPTIIDTDGKRKLVGEPIDHYRRHAHKRPAIGFCVSNDEAAENAALFSRAGYRTLAISGDSDPVLRDAAMRGIQEGQLDVVFNCKLWVAGVDVPAVSCILDMAPTDSLVRYLQGLGRGLRTHPGKDDLIYLDCVGNRARHGSPTDERIWTLASRAEGSGAVKNEVSVKTCPVCFGTVASVATHCRCGHEFEVVGRVLERIDGELHEVDGKAAPARPPAPTPEQLKHTEAELIEIGRKRGLRRPELWARAVLRERHGKQTVAARLGR